MTDTQSEVVIVGADGSEHVFPSGFDPKRAAAIVRGQSPPKPAPPPEKGWMQTAADFVKQHPTEIGATLGAVAAVPLTGGASLIPALAAAGLGGAGGAGLGMMAGAAAGGKVPTSASGVLRTMGEQGALQMVGEGGGRLIGGALKAGAGRLYQSVLKPTLAARREYPGLVKTGLEYAIPVSKRGAERTGELVGQSRDAADALVAARAAEPNAPMIDPRQAVGGITRAVREVRDLPVAGPQMKAIGDYARQYLTEHPSAIPLTSAQRAVRKTDRYFDSAYRASLDRGNPVTAGNTAAALGINDETRTLLRKAVPGLREQNANTSALMGLKEAVERRAGEQGNRSVIGMQHLINAGLGAGAGALGGPEKGIGTFAAMEALTNPTIASQVAIGGTRAASLPYQQLLRAAYLASLAGSDTGR